MLHFLHLVIETAQNNQGKTTAYRKKPGYLRSNASFDGCSEAREGTSNSELCGACNPYFSISPSTSLSTSSLTLITLDWPHAENPAVKSHMVNLA